MHGQFKPPDHSKGDEHTIGGYMAVHDRPAAFSGDDGYSYSVEILAEETGDPAAPWGAYFLFVKWARLGAQHPEGHLESAFVMTGATEQEARDRIGAMSLHEVKHILDDLVSSRDATRPSRPWWDAMREEDGA
jgi:hypothetical protein